MDAPADDPIQLFAQVYQQAVEAIPVDPNAMVLSTAGAGGRRPTSRVVLMKGFDARGFTFYTNLKSRKAREALENPWAALCFFWRPLDKQVRVEGRVEQVSDAEADEYFATRPRGSRISAWASEQSHIIPGRSTLDAAVAEVEKRFADADVPAPPHWGGYLVMPDAVEFWQGRSNRLHDRLRYYRSPSGWCRERLAP